LEGRLIPNKSGLLEAALAFALDDMDKGEDSLILRHVDRSSSVFDKGES
jgi:hypothetical protein